MQMNFQVFSNYLLAIYITTLLPILVSRHAYMLILYFLLDQLIYRPAGYTTGGQQIE